MLKEDSDLLLQIKDQDLIARELVKHEKCYKDYTRIVSKEKDETRNNKLAEENIDHFEVVCQIIEKRVVDCSQAISMSALIEVYGGSCERQYRYVLKERLSKRFSDRIIFSKSEYHEPYIVISAVCLQSTPLASMPLLNDEYHIQQAASILCSETLDFIESKPDLSWPPTVEELLDVTRLGPEKLLIFFKKLLSAKDSHHAESATESTIADKIHDTLCILEEISS